MVELRAGAGTQFDPEVVAALIAELGLSDTVCYPNLFNFETKSSRLGRAGRRKCRPCW